MPAWVNSDHLTLLGFVAMFLAGLSYWLARFDRRALMLVIAMLAVNWFGDSLDGTLARVRNRQRRDTASMSTTSPMPWAPSSSWADWRSPATSTRTLRSGW